MVIHKKVVVPQTPVAILWHSVPRICIMELLFEQIKHNPASSLPWGLSAIEEQRSKWVFILTPNCLLFKIFISFESDLSSRKWFQIENSFILWCFKLNRAQIHKGTTLFSLPSFVTDGKFDHKLSLNLTCRYSNSFLPIASTCTCKIKRQFIDLKKGIWILTIS